MDAQQVEIIKVIREGGLFDYLCNHGHELDKETLLRVTKELAYGLHNVGGYSPTVLNTVLNNIGNELVDWWGED